MSVSAELYRRALTVSPGGVHSPVRAFKSVGGAPLFMCKGTGATITDVDHNLYTDYCMAFGPLIFGHADAGIADAAAAALADGWSFGTAEPWSLQLAELIQSGIPWAERIRFVNSGTEAVMSALRLARAATGRRGLLKFAGGYHGHADAMLVAAGSGMSGIPASAGIDPVTAAATRVAELDDIEGLRALFQAEGPQLAAAIIEPLPANHGLLPQRPGFLRELARLCKAHGVLLIFDEVISGFRVAFGGCAELTGIEPDLVTWGKIIGGGFPVGAYAGREELMQQLAPEGAVYQAGTLSANPLAMRSGLATLTRLRDGAVYEQLEELGARLQQQLPATEHRGLTRVGSLFWPFSGNGQSMPRQPGQIPSQQAERFPGLFRQLLAQGIYFPPSPFEVCFLSTAHTSADIDRLATALSTT